MPDTIGDIERDKLDEHWFHWLTDLLDPDEKVEIHCQFCPGKVAVAAWSYQLDRLYLLPAELPEDSDSMPAENVCAACLWRRHTIKLHGVS